MIITIDGPVASGKSSVAKALAKKLGFYYLNTGFLYRATAYILLHELKKQLQDLTQEDMAFLLDISYKYQDDKPFIFYKTQDITGLLSSPIIEQQASKISVVPVIRQALLDFQRMFASQHDIIADGRDCGSVVFPNADFKFFLTADTQTRAHRLMADGSRTYTQMPLEQVQDLIIERDMRDRMRAIAPLVVPKGAIVIDNSKINFDETLALFLDYLG